jgi:hypothetical protein
MADYSYTDDASVYHSKFMTEAAGWQCGPLQSGLNTERIDASDCMKQRFITRQAAVTT